MQYKWKVLSVEKDISSRVPAGSIAIDEIGSFEVFTKAPARLKEGSGTVFVYIQGVNMKYGSEDFIGNSPTSWVEESIFPDVTENVRKNYLLPIGHVARRLNFDHFISFVFPKNLTAGGFRVAMKGLLSYLGEHKFVTIIISFSNGAALTGEWLLNQVNDSDSETLQEVSNNISLVVCAGGPCQTDDLERKAGVLGKAGLNPLLTPVHAVAGLHPIVKQAGGIDELMSRGKYLFNLDNLGKAAKVTDQKWDVAKKILETGVRPNIIFLADYGQRLVLPKGPINWYSIFAPKLGDNVKGFIAKNVNKHWFEIPTADHAEIKQLWSIIALIGVSLKLRRALNFSPIANEIANIWPTRRFEDMKA